MGKIQAIQYLDRLGLNTPELLLTMSQFLDKDKKAVIWESALAKLNQEDKDQKVSIRTERDGEVLCPHHPNISLGEADKRVRDLYRSGYSIHIFRGINPDQCWVKGNAYRIQHEENNRYGSEFIVGPGTVRSLEGKTPENYTAKILDGGLVVFLDKSNKFPKSVEDALRQVFRTYHKHRDTFKTDILEWSYYTLPVGKMKEHFIFWELRTWK